MASEIEYFCTKEAGNMTIPIGEGKYVKIVPKEIERIPVRGYRKLAGIWNRELAALYDRLWREADEYAMNNFKGEELDYYYRITD